MISVFVLCFIILFQNISANDEFSPFVTASCKGGFMNIKIKFASPYYGAVHVRDIRKSPCMQIGKGEENINFNVNIFSKEGDSDFCGIFISKNQERSIQLAVRVHKNLELAEDKFFIITCGKNGIYKDENAKLVFYEKSGSLPLKETLYGHQYEIKAELKNATHPIIVKNCVAFDKNDSTIPLINEYGCPYNPDIITPFIHDYETKTSKSTLKSMFKFPEKSEVHLQCDIGQCENNCFDVSMCNNVNFAGFTAGNSNDQNSSVNDIKKQLTTTTVFVLDPSESKGCSNNSGVKPSWILWLTVAFGVLFVIMLLMNIFLCTAMNCSWARTDIIEKEPSIIEEYDPYRSWHGSQYGSRYSLQGRDSQAKGYISGGSTIHSTRSDRY